MIGFEAEADVFLGRWFIYLPATVTAITVLQFRTPLSYNSIISRTGDDTGMCIVVLNYIRAVMIAVSFLRM